MTAMTLRAWLREAPFTLAMSSGFFGFYAHAGALTALAAAGFVPSGYAGSSAGALVAGLKAGGCTLDELRQTLSSLRRQDFWDPGPGLGLLRGRRFRERLDAMVRHRTIETCPTPYTASVFELSTRHTRSLHRGSLTAAIHASCALPGLFQPVRIDGSLYADGGIADRPGIYGLHYGSRVLHHHLASRSPWRREGSASTRPPKRNNLVAVSIEGVTRLNPFALDRGMTAFREGEEGMRRALDLPVHDGLVAVR